MTSASSSRFSADALAWRVEETSLNAFPALRQVLLGRWLLRFSEGQARRFANSASPLRAPAGDVDALISMLEALYHRQRLPAMFRIPSLIDPLLDARLDTLGYTRVGESCVLYGDIGAVAAASDPEVVLLPEPTADWCAEMARLQGFTPRQGAVYRRIVEMIRIPAAFASLPIAGPSAALAYGTIHDGLLCYESVITDRNHRRRGFARRVIAALAAWGRDNGAEGACLQVEVGNMPAQSLYDTFGLKRELYRG